LKEQIGKFIERKERNAERKTSAKYSFECVKFYTSCFCLRQVATGHFVDLTPLGIFFNLLEKKSFLKRLFVFEDNNI
jgi:hypothetical protein